MLEHHLNEDGLDELFNLLTSEQPNLDTATTPTLPSTTEEENTSSAPLHASLPPLAPALESAAHVSAKQEPNKTSQEVAADVIIIEYYDPEEGSP